ncbi:8-amino-7-oxononanoate synthase [uncultured Gordonia sp.]|uniref:8-amino-7-oxononanoate synthase n=1 Tax=Gordonia sp. (in: high G+C Gram-positive bacteria) TaxID=84139 RepID=UPI002632D1DF|nr:8-amino-7-oxononanoate synthase [uncultured Gordonia sp.]
MTDALGWLDEAAEQREQLGLHRDPPVRGAATAGLLNLSSNDYLGLSADPRVIAGAARALADFGAGSTGSRLVSGTTQCHTAFEADLADFTGFGAGLCFSSGYLANLGAISALVGRGDLIVSDAGAHASLIDGCRLSRARVVVVDRGDVAGVAAALAAGGWRRALVVTDSVYSVDGEIAPIADLYAVARAHGAALLVDEAHALGVRGPGGRGVIAESGLSGAPDLVMTTVMSKSLGAQGGAVLGSTALRAHLSDTARPFIFDTGLNPAAVGAAAAALDILARDPSLAQRVRANAAAIATVCGAPNPSAAVVSLIIGDPHRAADVAARCRDDGVLVGCFRPPSVPVGTSRLRITARADLDAAAIEHVGTVVNRHREAVSA